MKPTSVLQHIGVALVLTCLAAVNDLILRQFFSELLSDKLNISLLVFLYLSYLIRQNRLPAGRITLLVINLSVLLFCLFAVTQTTTLLLIYLTMIWLNRSLLRYSSLLTILADLGLCLISASLVYWVFVNGYSILTTLWCFLLLQALHSLIPTKKAANNPKHTSPSFDNFDRSLQSAENALQQLLRKV